MCIHLPFDYHKGTQAINYFARQSGGQIDKMKVLKLVFFADRFHLRKYGRPITNDEYIAMEYGPVASGVKDLIDQCDFLGTLERDYSSKYLEYVLRHDVKSKHAIDTDVFSDSELEALEFAWQKFGDQDGLQLSDITHAYPEWKTHEAQLKMSSRVRMSLEDFLQDPPDDYEQCFALNEEEKEDRLEQLQELAQLESLWR
jgi:uncharacterized phage-associated protein